MIKNWCDSKIRVCKVQAAALSRGLFFYYVSAFLTAAFLLFSLAFGLPQAAAEAQSNKPKASQVLIANGLRPADAGMTRKRVRGEIGAKNANGLALVFDKDDVKRSSKEIWLPFEDEMYLEQYDSLASLEEGDTVTAIFDEDETGEGGRKLRGIVFERKAPVKVEEEVADEAEA
jgi:hypothetical protein